MPVSDELLVKKVQHGELQAFRMLVERYQDWVYNLAFKMLGAPEDAKDATQEVFVRVYRALPGFRGESKFSTWLYRLASNRCLDMARARQREGGRTVSLDGEGILAEKLADSGAGPEELTTERDTRERVRRAVN